MEDWEHNAESQPDQASIDMRLGNIRHGSEPWRSLLVVLTVVASLVAGASYLAYASPLSPLIVGGVLAAIALGFVWLQKPVWALYAAIFVTLLPEGILSVDNFSILKNSLLFIALGAWLLDVTAHRRRIIWSSTALFMLGFVAWATISLFWAPHLDLGIERLVQYALRLILFFILIGNEITTRETLDGLMRTLAISGWILVVAGVATILFDGYEAGTRLKVFGEQVNRLGYWLIIMMPGVLWQAITASRRQKSLQMALSSIYVLLAILLVALSGSRGSAISLFAALLAFIFWKPTRFWGTLGLITLAVVAILAPFILSATTERFVEQSSGLLGGRIPLWRAAMMLIRDHPWNGVGIGNSPVAVMPYLERLVGVYKEATAAIHNPLLAVWAETGIPGTLLYLGVLGTAIWSFIRWGYRRGWVREPLPRAYLALVSSTFLGYMLSWVKVGGIEYHRSYYFVLALLLIPAHLGVDGFRHRAEADARGGRSAYQRVQVPEL